MKALIVIVLIVAAVFAYRDMASKQNSAADLPRTDGYLEVRATMNFGPHDFEFVIVEEKPLLDHCIKPEIANELIASCPAEFNCKISRFECKSAVDNRYLNMLARKPAQLHYTHVELNDISPARNGAMVVWGMSKEDSMTFCQMVSKTSRPDDHYKAVLACI